MDHPNVEIARRFLEALDGGDVATIESVVAEDVVAHFPGNNIISGTYHGREEFFKAFAKADELTGGIERELHDITASDDHVVILVNLSARRGQKRISWNGANVWHIRSGVLTEVWLLSADQAATDEALA